MSQYYPTSYEAYQDKKENWLFRLGRRRLWARRFRAVRRHFLVSNGSVLDIGCATGEFLAVLQKQGWHVAGVEPDPGAAIRARRRLNTDSIQSVFLKEAQFPDASFDLITLWDVLEHLPDPLVALRRLSKWLRSGGILAIGIPHLGSWDARLFGSAWIGWDAPRHLYLFPEDTLKGILAEAGLQPIEARCFYGDYGAFILSLDFALKERFGEGKGGRFLRRLTNLRPWRYLLWPYFRLAEWANRGPIRTYFCRHAAPATIIPPGSW
jgi:SAM-dependent methyltransferase